MATEAAMGAAVLFEPGAPRFVGGLLLGLAELTTEQRADLEGYLCEVARQRKLPLHPAIAWNALYYGWDLERGEYDARAVSLDGFSEVGARDEAVALPVGAFTWLTSRGGTRLWAEIVYKEGRDATVGDFGEVAAGDSGRRGRLDDCNRCHRRELLVPDITVFGRDAGLQLVEARFRRRGRLTPEGHLLVDAVYDPHDLAERSELEQYARWLWLAAGDELRAGPIGVLLGEGATEEEYWRALVASLATVSDLLATSSHFRRVGAHFVLREAVAERLDRRDAVLGGGDVDDLRATLRARATPGPISYTALLPLLLERAGSDADLCAVAYPATVVEVNAAIAELLPDEEDGIDLRLDDDGESAGIWRTERVPEDVVSPLVGLDPALPLHLGAGGDAAHLAAHTSRGAEPAAPEVPDPIDAWDVDQTHPAWVWALRDSDLERGTLRLPDRIKAVLAEHQGMVHLRLRHDGEIAAHQRSQRVRLSADGEWVVGIAWPPLLRGVRITAWVARESATIEAFTRRLEQPVHCAGLSYEFDFDRAIAEGRQPTGSPPADLSLSLFVVSLVRRQGHASADGRSRSLSVGEVSVLLGHLEPDIRRVRRALDEAVDAGRLVRDPDGVVYRWIARRVAVRPAPEGDDWLDDVRDPGDDVRDRIAPRRYWVVAFLRRLPTGHIASEAAREAYRRFAADLAGGLPAELPPGVTFVTEHARGGTP